MHNSQTEIWCVTSISNAYGVVFPTGPRDVLMVAFTSVGVELSFVTRGEDYKPQIRRYHGASLGDRYYKLMLPEPERRAILVAFCSYMTFQLPTTLDRYWVESGEPELWRLALENQLGCIGITIHFALRG